MFENTTGSRKRPEGDQDSQMKHFNEEAFLTDVSDIDWVRLLDDTDDINILVNKWSNLFSTVIGKHAPLTEMRVSEKFCPWTDKGPKDLMRTRDRLKRAATKNMSMILMESYRKVRNKVDAQNRKLKKQCYTDKFLHVRAI